MKRLSVLLVIGLCACAKARAQEPAPAAVPDSVRRALVEPGLGTLKQDEFTLGIRSGPLLVKVTPLNERVIRLAAPDTYGRLHALAESRRADAARRVNGGDFELFLVSFFSYQPDVAFQPEDVQLDYNGRLLRASAIIPLTASWGKQRLDQQETQAAVYVFGSQLDFEQPLIVKYGFDQNADWQRIIPKLEVERGKIRSRTNR